MPLAIGEACERCTFRIGVSCTVSAEVRKDICKGNGRVSVVDKVLAGGMIW